MAKQNNWIAFGKKLNESLEARALNTTAPNAYPIPIQEEIDFGIHMPESKGASEKNRLFGIPIDINCAVHMMKEMLLHMCRAGLDLRELPLITEKEGDEQLKTLAQLMVTSFGMTFDRSIILKIFSQPGCEGIRFYLGKKKADGKDYLSLILVGVDKDGFDLLYNSDEDQSNNGNNQAAQAPSVDTQSLLGEYGHPPNNLKFREHTEQFVLLRLAEREAKVADESYPHCSPKQFEINKVQQTKEENS